MKQEIKSFYRKDLPHYQPPHDTVFFITTRLAGSLPKHKIEELKKAREKEIQIIQSSTCSHEEKLKQVDNAHKRFFGKYDIILDNLTTGNHWLKIHPVAEIVAESLKHFDGQRYDLICYTIMSNHIHVVFELKKEFALYGLLQSIKSFSAKKANELLDRTGQFWQHESYDRVVRDNNELSKVVNYVLNNPVKAGLCKNWQDWKHSFVSNKYQGYTQP